MFLKLKIEVNIKGRTAEVGNRQQDFISKEYSISPPVTTEAVLLTCVIYSQEDRSLAIIDILNALIQTKVDKEEDMFTIKFREAFVDVLLEISRSVQAIRLKG